MNRYGAKAMSASKRFALKTADKASTIIKSMSGRSKGELRKVSLPSLIVFKTKKIKKSAVASAKAISFGKTNASVVVVRKSRGKTRRKNPITNRLMFSK